MQIIMEIHALADAIQRDAGRMTHVHVHHMPATSVDPTAIEVVALISDYDDNESPHHPVFKGDTLERNKRDLESVRDRLADWLCERRKQLREVA